MDSILVACETRDAAERGLRAAADLSVACGARLLLACVRPAARSVRVPSGLDALAHLSDVLFEQRDWRSPAPAFAAAPQSAPDWIPEMRGAVDECWVVGSEEALLDRLAASRPDLVVAAEGKIADRLMRASSLPVWKIGKFSSQRPWFTMRKLRCSVRGAKSAAWARDLAVSLGAELELADSNADLTVVSRESIRSAFLFPGERAVVVV